ncbi:acyl-CoA synthetase (AMP-forming)/AMP-acid ligase II [Crossiella equi]|uniref:Acyl-CoA synthetase (AMP-forming)/AMP-acid ligase II n=1 Tax=Crossiella equi TaxID=130796 RepID=A0ABS5AB31_9PSEU|nr:fatty acyl-AMP ligase [Crossiella equi]MBP2473502.1 acyl-CoA synthetase (AMP-forming)/AMP-acid ligase II [Crossiella equi]
MSTLVDAVRRQAVDAPDSPAMTFTDHRRGGATTTTGYRELDRRARALGAHLARRCAPGARIAVLCPHSLDYVVAVLGCLYAGRVAVPLSAPELFRDHGRLRAVLTDCAPHGVLTTSGVRPAVDATLAELAVVPELVVEVDRAAGWPTLSWRRPETGPEDLAYLQYTSGSTGDPAGVRITHGNLAAANEAIRDHYPARVVASWLPFFHDFGLVCAVLHPLSAGAHAVHTSPAAFVRDPLRWLDLVSEHRADWTIAPAFSLERCVRRASPDRLARLDLSCLRLVTVAAEPVHAEAVARFAGTFAGCGLDPAAPTPCYGLAEATLPVTAPPVGAGLRTLAVDRAALTAGRAVPAAPGVPAVHLVSCGTPRLGVSVRVAAPDGRVGEVLVRGAGVADGYWRRPARSAEVFGGGWLRTGDLGFTHEGALYLAGRCKEVVIVRGRNHYPADLETTVRRALPPEAGAAGLAAAFAVPGPAGERLVVLVEVAPELLAGSPSQVDETRTGLRRLVAREHGVEVHELRLVHRGALPRTSSGKIRRGACREQYLGELPTDEPLR